MSEDPRAHPPIIIPQQPGSAQVCSARALEFESVGGGSGGGGFLAAAPLC
jgi:hypothetical protein